VKIHYEVNLDDLIAWNLYHFDHSPAMKRSRAIIVWGVAVVIPLPIAFQAIHKPEVPILVHAIALSLVLIVAVVWVLAVPPYLRWATVRQARKMYAEGANKGTLGPHELELTDTRLIERTPVNEYSVTLESIERVARSDTHPFVYLSAVLAHVIPRAALGERDYEEFVQALEARVAKAKGR
jgi:hypothetical protein